MNDKIRELQRKIEQEIIIKEIREGLSKLTDEDILRNVKEQGSTLVIKFEYMIDNAVVRDLLIKEVLNKDE